MLKKMVEVARKMVQKHQKRNELRLFERQKLFPMVGESGWSDPNDPR